LDVALGVFRLRRRDPRPLTGQYEDAKFRLHVMNEHRKRGDEDTPLAAIDGLEVFDYFTTIFPVICG
jgi:hypothetical protein